MCFIYTRLSQHTARGPNVARKSFQYGPQSPNLGTFGLIFDVYVAGICRNQAFPEMPRQFRKCLDFPKLPRQLQKMIKLTMFKFWEMAQYQ